jgi:hypothetical protein
LTQNAENDPKSPKDITRRSNVEESVVRKLNIRGF